MPDSTALGDDQILASFGYKQELRRALKLFSLYAVAFSIISITTGIFTNFGFGLAHLGPAFIWFWLLGFAGQLLVALVVSELGTRIPLAGYSYQWGSRLVNSTYGWFVGFTGLCYLSEEAVNARVTVPKAVIWSVVSSGVLGMFALIGFALAIPDLQKIAASPVPIADIFSYWLGSGLTKVFLLFVVFSIFALSVIGTAATARLIFSMARDNILPFSPVLKQVNPRTRTPIPALLSSSGLAILFTLYGYIDVIFFGGNAFIVLITATATLPFLVYLGTVVAYAWKRKELMSLPGAFDLGPWARPVMIGALVWVVLVLAMLVIPQPYWGADVVCIIVEVVALAWWALALRQRLEKGEAGVTQITSTAPPTATNPAPTP